MTSREYDVGGESGAERTDRVPERVGLLEGAVPSRLEGFPWKRGFRYGAIAFVGGYAVFLALYVVGLVQVTGSPTVQLKRVAFLFYGAHNVIIVGNTNPAAITVTYEPLARVGWPLVFRLVPLAVTLLAAGAFTRERRSGDAVASEAVATGLVVGTGYATVAFLGTFVFTIPAGGAGYHPAMADAAAFTFAYGFVAGLLASLALGLLGGPGDRRDGSLRRFS